MVIHILCKRFLWLNLIILNLIIIFSHPVQAYACGKQRVPHSIEDLKEQVGEDYRVYSNSNCIIATDLDKTTAEYVINGVLQSCKQILYKQFFDKRADDIVTIYIFKDKTSYFTGLKRLLSMNPISPYGHYGHNNRYIVVNYATGPGTLVHELTHSLMAVDFPSAPIWISEGIASLYEQCKVDNGVLKGVQNWRLPELHNGISSNRFTPLKYLFKSDTKCFRMLRESLHYAESRYFCMYLQERGLLERVYKAYRSHPFDSDNGIKVVEQAFGKSIDAVEADWIEWVKHQKWNGEGYKE